MARIAEVPRKMRVAVADAMLLLLLLLFLLILLLLLLQLGVEPKGGCTCRRRFGRCVVNYLRRIVGEFWGMAAHHNHLFSH